MIVARAHKCVSSEKDWKHLNTFERESARPERGCAYTREGCLFVLPRRRPRTAVWSAPTLGGPHSRGAKASPPQPGAQEPPAERAIRRFRWDGDRGGDVAAFGEDGARRGHTGRGGGAGKTPASRCVPGGRGAQAPSIDVTPVTLITLAGRHGDRDSRPRLPGAPPGAWENVGPLASGTRYARSAVGRTWDRGVALRTHRTLRAPPGARGHRAHAAALGAGIGAALRAQPRDWGELRSRRRGPGGSAGEAGTQRPLVRTRPGPRV